MPKAQHKNIKPNRLINEKSPYLLQHAYNPVDWYPWSEEAFEKAKKEDKPVFLSIGYSCCHWCHVMEKESFDNKRIADLLNRDYVAIKVDREERPDIDGVYIRVCQAISGHGGWPLTIIMTPDRIPFYAGTYLPPNNRAGLKGMSEVLPKIADLWKNERDLLLQSGQEIVNWLTFLDHHKSEEKKDVSESLLHQGFQELSRRFDPSYGGFGPAPKFPSAHIIIFLLRYYRLTANKEALRMAEKTLEGIYRGGIYDHIGFGFSRYSTDNRWLIPHFEKMLYDNA
ncbi:MAG: thioredoxin domain-containing protein, partial [Syntrophomonadaceae bacterium]|nr:thioredoxin domain-containing protein [Syntrophomonadaceae bacterium]